MKKVGNKKHDVVENAQFISYWSDCEDKRMKRKYCGFKNAKDEIYHEEIVYEEKTFYEKHKLLLILIGIFSFTVACLLLAGAVLPILTI